MTGQCVADAIFISRDTGHHQEATGIGKMAAGNNLTMAGDGATEIGRDSYKSVRMQL